MQTLKIMIQTNLFLKDILRQLRKFKYRLRIDDIKEFVSYNK